MGKFKVGITLANAGDKVRIEDGVLKKERKVAVQAVVDTGATTLAINKAVFDALGLAIVEEGTSGVADGRSVYSAVTTPVEVRWKDRSMVCRARLLPRARRILLGAIPLEDMDLMVDPKRQRLVGVHGKRPYDEID